jgi:hypothetical protein
MAFWPFPVEEFQTFWTLLPLVLTIALPLLSRLYRLVRWTERRRAQADMARLEAIRAEPMRLVGGIAYCVAGSCLNLVIALLGAVAMTVGTTGEGDWYVASFGAVLLGTSMGNIIERYLSARFYWLSLTEPDDFARRLSDRARK